MNISGTNPGGINLRGMNPRVLVAVVVGVLILTLLNWNIIQRERLIEQGRVVLLRLAPVDPRSLMQGDYMTLNFALANEIRNAAQGRDFGDEETIGGKLTIGGKAILKLDENNVAHFVRIDDGKPLQNDEVRLLYRTQGRFDTVRIATNAFFFAEGQGEIYEPARYGEFRVADNGDAILTQLRDAHFNVLGRSAVLD